MSKIRSEMYIPNRVKCVKTDFHTRLDWRESHKKENKSVQRLERGLICKMKGIEVILVLPKENRDRSQKA